MGKIILYSVDIDNGEFLREKEILDVDSDSYALTIYGSITTDTSSYYLAYAVHAGSVYTPKEGETTIICSGVFRNYDIDNTWIAYYKTYFNLDQAFSNASDYMYTGETSVRLAYGYSLDTMNEALTNGTITNDEGFTAQYSADFYSIEIPTGAMAESFFTYGSTFSPTCTIEMSNTSKLSIGMFIRIEFEIDGVWRNFGVFYMKEAPEKTSEIMTVHGCGMLETILDNGDVYPPDGKVTVHTLCEWITEETGVPVEFEFRSKILDSGYQNTAFFEMPYELEQDSGGNYSVKQQTAGSYRSWLSAIATIFNSNVIERNGIVYISHVDVDTYAENKRFTFDEDSYGEEPVSRSEKPFIPTPVSVSCLPQTLGKIEQIAPDITNTVFRYSSQEKLDIPIVDWSADQLTTAVMYPVAIEANYLYGGVSTYFGNVEYTSMRKLAEDIGVTSPYFQYRPAEIEFLGYHDAIYAGGMIKLSENEEIEDFYVGNVTVSWDGMFSMSVSTPCDIDISANTSSVAGNGNSGINSTSGIGINTIEAIKEGGILDIPNKLSYNKETGALSLMCNDKVLSTVQLSISSGSGEISGSSYLPCRIVNPNVKVVSNFTVVETE